MPALPEVFDMLAVVRVEAALAVSTATALHHFQGVHGFPALSASLRSFQVSPPMPSIGLSTLEQGTWDRSSWRMALIALLVWCEVAGFV